MTVKTRGMEKDLTNHELAGMLGFDDLDITKTVPQGCWIQSNYSNYTVWVKLIQYDSDLDKLRKKLNSNSNEMWKLDMLFKIAASIKKLHDVGVCHFDIKE